MPEQPHTSKHPIVLADANNFYASCEAVFHPEVAGKPLVVLSNNDGCVVSRSAEAKALGIANGTPWFTIRQEAAYDQVIARSSNYELYGSLSHRMMSIMSRFLPGQEIYSIDECFLHSPWDTERTRLIAADMRRTVLQGVGIPVSIGIAPTKTLAKITNHWAKRHPSSHGITTWSDLSRNDHGTAVLASTEIDDIWGIGRRLAKRLRGLGIRQAAQLRDQDPAAMRRLFSVQLERTILELRGVPCIAEDNDATGGKRDSQILCSRMFGTPIRGEEGLRQAASVYAQYACRRLQRQHSLCTRVSVFCASSPFNAHDQYSSACGSILLQDPSDDPVIISAAARQALHGSITPSVRYVRAGVMLTGLVDADAYDTLPTLGARTDPGLSEAFEQVARRFGPAHVGIGYAGIRGDGRNNGDTGASWTMRREMLSARCTTRWDEMPVVRAD
ncbi:Y-family DNA polymerase [Bifidobacterium apri]|uniref:Y-family DNA polymerase n=1 Tax=Bifidobacterium apri TaxID=1769423 RepID=UPI0039962A4D